MLSRYFRLWHAVPRMSLRSAQEWYKRLFAFFSQFDICWFAAWCRDCSTLESLKHFTYVLKRLQSTLEISNVKIETEFYSNFVQIKIGIATKRKGNHNLSIDCEFNAFKETISFTWWQWRLLNYLCRAASFFSAGCSFSKRMDILGYNNPIPLTELYHWLTEWVIKAVLRSHTYRTQRLEQRVFNRIGEIIRLLAYAV